MIRRPPGSTLDRSSAASDVYKRQVLVSAPQKGWSGPPCCGLVMLGARALARIEATTSTSFSLDLKKWLQIMQTYESGGHAYHATLPTDGLARLRDVMQELAAFGFDRAKVAQQQLGDRVRALLAHEGIASVAASGFQSPGVVVSYTCLLYTSPSPRDRTRSRMPSSA